MRARLWEALSGSILRVGISTSNMTTEISEFPRRLRAMLENRFHLVFHRDVHTLPVYFLEVSKGGTKLKEPTSTTGGMSAGQRMIRYSSATMREFADQLSSYFERQVLDRTELKD